MALIAFVWSAVMNERIRELADEKGSAEPKDKNSPYLQKNIDFPYYASALTAAMRTVVRGTTGSEPSIPST